MKACPKCKRPSNNEQCAVCKIVFAEYEQRKEAETGQVYKLISAGKLEQAKALAQTLANEFPDSKGDFILLISNINRDLNIGAKHRQALELFKKGEYKEISLLLRNLKAFDPGLAEKVITLRRRAEQRIGSSSKLEQAAVLFEQKQYSSARSLLLQISSDSGCKKEVKKLLAQIEAIKSGRLREVADCLSRSLFTAAREHLASLISLFPEAKQEQAPLFVLLEKRKEISDKLAAAAHKAKNEQRFLEAKVLYAFLLWQDQELRPSLGPYLASIGPQPPVSLADCTESELKAWAALGVQVTPDGLLKPVPTKQERQVEAAAAKIMPVPTSLPSAPDLACEPADIDGEAVADFA